MSESQKYDKPIEVVKMFINKCDCRSEICNATCDDKKRILDQNEDLCFAIIICINRLLGMCVLQISITGVRYICYIHF